MEALPQGLRTLQNKYCSDILGQFSTSDPNSMFSFLPSVLSVLIIKTSFFSKTRYTNNHLIFYQTFDKVNIENNLPINYYSPKGQRWGCSQRSQWTDCQSFRWKSLWRSQKKNHYQWRSQQKSLGCSSRRTTNGRGPGGGPNCPGEQTHNRSIFQV